MGSKCKTCGLTERSHHPCNEAGTLYPCPDEFHREMSIVHCQQPGCTSHGLTRARVWWCAIHHPEHPMGPVAPTPPAPADDAGGAEAMREAFVAHMASVGTTGVVWTPDLGPVGYRNDRHSAFLTVEWERFAAGYRAALPARREEAVVEARDRVFHTAGTAKVLRTVYEIGMEARMYCVDADREAALRDVQDAEDAMDRAVIDYSKALAALRGTRPEGHGGGK